MEFRPDILQWYERQGYTKTGETKPFPARHIMLEGHSITFIMLRKPL